MDKVKQIPDFYTERVAPIHFQAFMYNAGEHELHGGTIEVPVPHIHTLYVVPQVVKIAFRFTDQCSCPVKQKDKCHLILPFILCNN